MSRPVDTEPSFADLIRAREEQHATLVRGLSKNNAKLRDKLHRARSASPGGSISSDDTEVEEAPRSLPPPAALGTDAAGGSTPPPEGGNAAARSTSNPRSGGSKASLEAISDLHGMLGALQQLVQSQHEATKSQIEELRTDMENRCGNLEGKLSDLQAAVAVEERTSSLLREEQTEQHMTMCSEIDSLRSIAVSVEQRLDARDEALQALEESARTTQSASETFEERLVNLEGFPSSLRSEIVDLDEKFASMSASVRAERASILQQNTEIRDQQAAEFREIIVAANDELDTMREHATEAIANAKHAQEKINQLVTDGIAELASRLEGELAERVAEQDSRVAAAQQRQAVEAHNMNQTISEALTEVRGTVDSSLIALRTSYDGAVKDQLEAIVTAADEHEQKRREEFPVVDSDRVAIMLQELEGAQTLIEGIARNTMAMGHKCPLTNRVKELENKLDDVLANQPSEVEGRDGSGNSENKMKIVFTVPVQTDPMGEDVMSPRDRVAAMVDRKLAAEMEKVAVEQEDNKMWRAVEQAGGRQPSASVQSARGTSSSALSARGTSVVSQPDGGVSNRSRSYASAGAPGTGSLEEIRGQIRIKEGQLQKIQQVLRTIQEKFHDLTQKESKSAAGRPSSAEAKQVAELIAKQKDAVYQHERQLVDQRNKLLHDIRLLSAREQEMLR